MSVSVSASISVMRLHLGMVPCEYSLNWEDPRVFQKVPPACFPGKLFYGVPHWQPLLWVFYETHVLVLCKAPLCAQASLNTQVLSSSSWRVHIFQED